MAIKLYFQIAPTFIIKFNLKHKKYRLGIQWEQT